MATNQYVNKFVQGGVTRFDLTADTITAADLAEGVTAHDKSGAPITGTNTYDSDTSDDTAAVAEILAGKTAHARGSQLTGTMPNRGGVTGTIATKNGTFTIPQGYHDGSGSVGLDPVEKAKLVPENIRQGVTLFSIEGEMSGSEDVKAQSMTATPTFASQTITPDTASGYNYLSQVVVNPIPVTETDNSAGGVTVTVG